ncbi:hypothetical protein LMG28138_05797 [Pararobbsia alpina]|uniref:Uncharacterized protein n=1 Tax=Pararobbsia alpina TaxID=621374 RepID=A0A6S7BWX9_9BURK|nr:hypothetical protein LMG28138_05797 [Pararobbsia alpina]
MNQPSDLRAIPVTAIDILLEPDATMMKNAEAANARLRKSFPNGFALDETHQPHISCLQRYVRTADLIGSTRRSTKFWPVRNRPAGN